MSGLVKNQAKLVQYALGWMRSSKKVAIKMRNAMVASLIKHPKKTEEMEISRAEHKDAQNSKVCP